MQRHVILRNRPDVVAGWSDEEVAKRWWQLFPLRKNMDKTPAVSTEGEFNIWMTPARSKQLRSRLSDISWWMRALAEPIARRSNIEDNCTDRFMSESHRRKLSKKKRLEPRCAGSEVASSIPDSSNPASPPEPSGSNAPKNKQSTFQSEALEGSYVLDNDLLSLNRIEGGTLVESLSEGSAKQFNFILNGANKEDPGLTFAK